MFKVLEEKQLTHDLSYHHDLDNNDNFSPDGKWLVYDTRTDEGGIPESARIEKVSIETGEIKTVYEIQNNGNWGPGVGAVSYSPVEDAVVFIHGLPGCTPENPYQQWRRTGVIVRDSEPGKPIFMDARDITPPFRPGALRGGTHRHEWSGDGKWIGFTYNDAILQTLEDITGTKRNLRTIGVSKNIGPVFVNENAENISGEWFSVLVVRVVPNPIPGSDEISHAASDSWIGKNGYQKLDGNWQIARAFLGTIVDNQGNEVLEVFVVDIPDDITKPGEFGPLEGTDNDFPMPPAVTVQKRLTFTANSPFPGCSGIVRSSPDGSQLAFIAKDKSGINQIFTISPLGGAPQQLTWHDSDVTGNLRWHPGGESVTYVWKGSIVSCKVGNADFAERIQVLTKPSEQAPANLVWSHHGKVLAFNRLIEDLNTGVGSRQVFVLGVDI
ncbi:hypothetical protein DYBT9623_02937 [Dyadobacter sp. CECT 9623]|uniref:DUF3748 domain-containing protein n=1 Tax=Dyadobacter linearis TaxID=2823330 RepID=A0ABN7RE33_9BACT|nr:DUF3748 domain-containing protein [Dyadobacter sp. CECT 9623]CAG5070197.1 hypothetical protein DYBT9623_02937 [Dyadobacter sp. CECT 9623]